MKSGEIIEQLQKLAPEEMALEWDNPGLLTGRRDKEVRRILLALDATDAVVEQAVQQEADMLITHHPMLFRPVHSVTTDDRIGRRLIRLIQNDISYYAMHTNFDIYGMADLSAAKMQLQDAKVLEVTHTMEDGEEAGVGRFGKLPYAMKLSEAAEFVKRQFELPWVRVCGDLESVVRMAAISTGSGKSMIQPALDAQVDVLISGDLDHHTVIDALDDGLLLIDAGHYGTEHMFCAYMKDYLSGHIADVEVIVAREQMPYQIV